MTKWLQPITLRGKHVELRPLQLSDEGPMAEAVQDGELWKLWFTRVPSPQTMRAEIERRLGLQAKGTMLPFCVWNADTGAPIGMTTYLNADPDQSRIEIGCTWYREGAQRSPVNTECKLLLLRHAFEVLKCVAVEFRTSSFNAKSRRAIERLGAKLDGVLRCHGRHSDGSLRDTYVYSILATEWPAVETHLKFQLTRQLSVAGTHRR